jgi:hypothetical protein
MRMTEQEIIKKSPHFEDYDADWKDLYYTVYQSIQSNKYRVIRSNNTLFWIEIVSPGVAKLAIFNADSYKNFLRNIREFSRVMKVSGYKTVFGDSSDINIFNQFRKTGWQLDIKVIGKDKKGSVMYQGVGNVMR